jgi:hypothetical protein
MDERIAELEKVIVSQAKEIAALKGKASVQPETFRVTVSDLGAEIIQKYFEEINRRSSESRKRDKEWRESGMPGLSRD